MKVNLLLKNQQNMLLQTYDKNKFLNRNSFVKTNLTSDEFVSKVSFSAKPPRGLTVEQMQNEVVRLQKRLDLENLTKAVREDIEDTIDRLKVKIEWDMDEGGGASDSAAQRAIDNYIP